MHHLHASGTPLAPLAYHQALCDFLEAEEPAIWRWFSSEQYTDEWIETQKLELLKTTIRLAPDSNGSLYGLARQASAALGIDLPITLYQGRSGAINAMLFFLPEELCIVLEGSWSDNHNDAEILAMLGHEIAHHKLYTEAEGRYFTAARLLNWCQRQPDCPEAFAESYRRFGLFTEVYADLGSLAVTGDWQPAVTGLIKINSGLSQVSAEDYAKQADEVLAKHDSGSANHSHPELYVRTKLLQQAAARASQADLETTEWQTLAQKLIAGPLNVRSPDLLDQQQLEAATEQFINRILQQFTLPTDAILAMAQNYFPESDFSATEVLGGRDPEKRTSAKETFGNHRSATDHHQLETLLANCHDHTREYFCYVLMDFACVDPDLQPESFTLAFDVAQQLNLFPTFEPIFRKALKKKKAEVEKLLPTQAEAGQHD